MTPANVLNQAWNSSRIGIAEFKGLYTLPTWIFGWLLRVVFQVFFFSLIGRLLGSAEQVKFLLIGGALLAAALEAMVVVLSATEDRSSGMLAMLATTPGSHFVVYIFRHVNYLGTGLVTATFALFLGARVMRVDLHLPRALLVVPLIALGAATCYAFASFVGVLAARAAQAYWLSLNVSYMSLMALSGFTIPLGSWPAPLVWLAQVLPFTHGLQAIRSILGDTPDWGHVLAQVSLETLLLLAWLSLAWLAFRTTLTRARRNGDIDLPT